MKKKITVEVTHVVEVEIDDSYLTKKFMEDFREDFREDFYNFHTIEDHAKHIAQMEARELIGFTHFVEGYGILDDLRIKVNVVDQTEDVM